MRGLVRTPPPRAGDSARGSLARRIANTPEDQHQQLILELVRSEIAIVLGHATPQAIEPQRAFNELGFDSLAAVELRNRLNVTTGLQLPATLIFDYPSPAGLAEYLLGELARDQAGLGSGSSVDAQLDKLEAAVSSIAADDGERIRVTQRLQTVLSKLAAQERTAEDDDLAAATADEVFALMDKELGTF